jgi:signal transduction histidine kinase
LSWRSVADAVRAAHDLTLRLGKAAKETLRSADIMVERSDLRFDTYPLSVLVANCAEGFTEQANEANRKLTIDPSVENLPSAEVDIARLTIAISNILENAVKYSYPSTTINVRAIPLIQHVDNLEYVDIVIENTGNPIPQEKMQQIFERGRRALVDAKMGKIPGTGYGLWETKAVIEAHRGSITPTSERLNFQHRSGIPYKVTFRLRVPLSQS